MFEENYFGIVMNTGRFIHRRGYRKLWEDVLVLSSREVPLEIFLAATTNRAEAEKMHYEFNVSVHAKSL